MLNKCQNMNIEEYKKLIEVGYLSRYDGHVERYWDINDAPFRKNENYRKVLNNILNKQFDVKLDYNNIIILFPLATDYGVSYLHGSRENSFATDHCTYYLDIKEFLHKQGIKYKNGIKMNDRKYSQTGFAMLVVENGVAYACDTANPLKVEYSRDSFSEIKYDTKTDKINFKNKEIILSGFFVNQIRQFDKDAQKSFSKVLA